MILIVPAKYTATASVLVSSRKQGSDRRCALMETPLGESYVTTQASIIGESARGWSAWSIALSSTDDPKWTKPRGRTTPTVKGDLRKPGLPTSSPSVLRSAPGHESNVVEINYKSKYPASSRQPCSPTLLPQAYLETSAQN